MRSDGLFRANCFAGSRMGTWKERVFHQAVDASCETSRRMGHYVSGMSHRYRAKQVDRALRLCGEKDRNLRDAFQASKDSNTWCRSQGQSGHARHVARTLLPSYFGPVTASGAHMLMRIVIMPLGDACMTQLIITQFIVKLTLS